MCGSCFGRAYKYILAEIKPPPPNRRGVTPRGPTTHPPPESIKRRVAVWKAFGKLPPASSIDFATQHQTADAADMFCRFLRTTHDEFQPLCFRNIFYFIYIFLCARKTWMHNFAGACFIYKIWKRFAKALFRSGVYFLQSVVRWWIIYLKRAHIALYQWNHVFANLPAQRTLLTLIFNLYSFMAKYKCRWNYIFREICLG
jgi:hypothetical protein